MHYILHENICKSHEPDGRAAKKSFGAQAKQGLNEVPT